MVPPEGTDPPAKTSTVGSATVKVQGDKQPIDSAIYMPIHPFRDEPLGNGVDWIVLAQRDPNGFGLSRGQGGMGDIFNHLKDAV